MLADEQPRPDLDGWRARRARVRATWASWAVSSFRASTLRLRTCSPVASNSRSARPANASIPIAVNILERGAQLLPGVQSASLTAQPFAVEEVRAREVHANARAAKPFDRFPIEAFGHHRRR